MKLFARFIPFALIVGIGALMFVRADADQTPLAITFLDVGQGDATFIETPRGVQVLVDGGPDAGVLRELQREMGFFDRSIDIMVATHFDQDHIGGLVDVLERYDVSAVLVTDNKADTAVADAFAAAVEEEGAQLLYALAGQTISLLGGAEISVLFPDRSMRDVESNAASIVLQLAYGETEFLLTGDAPSGVELHLVDRYAGALASDVLKVGHHGSQTSSDEQFVTVVDPAFAVISAGADNRYGHPHPLVLDTFAALDIEIKNTASSGSIRFLSDGTRVRLLDN